MAVSGDGETWFLINASPDLRAQIEAFPPLQPRELRGSPIAGVLLTNADLDHVLGIFQLREGSAVEVHAADGVQEALAGGLRLDWVLGNYGGVEWRQPPRERGYLAEGLMYRAIPLPATPPRYAPAVQGDQSVAYELMDEATGARVVIAPDVESISPELEQAAHEASLLLFDGTFWDEEELRQISPKARLASEMGHLPISTGSLPWLRGMHGRKVLVHINNTNPILRRKSPERSAVESAGVVVGQDGMEFEI